MYIHLYIFYLHINTHIYIHPHAHSVKSVVVVIFNKNGIHVVSPEYIPDNPVGLPLLISLFRFFFHHYHHHRNKLHFKLTLSSILSPFIFSTKGHHHTKPPQTVKEKISSTDGGMRNRQETGE